MDIISRATAYVSDLLHSAYCYFDSNEESCAAPQTSAQGDHFQQVELREVEIHHLIETSRQVPVGCYIQMHQVPNYEALRRQTPTGTPRK